MKDVEIRKIGKPEYAPWLLERHYARRLCSVSFAFGLYIDGSISGVVTYGSASNSRLVKVAGQKAYELNRLCIDDGAPRNSASVLVGRTIKLLPAPCVLVSYADRDQGHVGYVYQATNWLYTGLSGSDRDFEKDGVRYHRKTMYSRHGTSSVSKLADLGYIAVPIQGKHRYVYLVGNKREKREMMRQFPWPILPYPKGESRRYDASPKELSDVS